MTGDVYLHINSLDDATVDQIAQRLESRALNDDWMKMREEYLDQLDLANIEQVLVMGSGTGVVPRALLSREEFTGQVTGIDINATLTEHAKKLTPSQYDGRVHYLVGDAQALNVEPATFDLVILHTLLLHIADPGQALAEAARVVRPGGTVLVFDTDASSWVFGYPDLQQARRMLDAIHTAIINNPAVIHELPQFARSAGLQIENVTPYAVVDMGGNGFWTGLLEGYEPLVTNAGVIPSEEVENWYAYQHRSIDEGTFFGSGNTYTIYMNKT